MPGRDGTGPNGDGPLTGRGLGPCEGRRGFGRGGGFGRGRGFRRGWNCPWGFLNPESEKNALLREKELIEARLKEIDGQAEKV